MENFEPLASRLVESGGAQRVAGESELVGKLREVIADPDAFGDGSKAAKVVLDGHRGATGRILDLLDAE